MVQGKQVAPCIYDDAWVYWISDDSIVGIIEHDGLSGIVKEVLACLYILCFQWISFVK
ncbi:MAG: hypothetical protein NZ455_16690 [Bacteroidia bacterium]|nr:hypothetical protein [Bacteroidia bacterium]MDW8348491.1 hypothetical protein [Bacteroidia bacterium]